MKQTVFALLGLLGLSLLAQAQDRIYRCGNEYTNTVPQGHEKGCKLVEGGNVTVVQGQRPAKATAPKSDSFWCCSCGGGRPGGPGGSEGTRF
jgi:hypothetical protein